MLDKIALVTGSSSGFGLLTTVELARAGFHVVATMRDPGRRSRLEQAAAAEGVTQNVEIRQLDITQTETIEPLIAQVVRAYGRIDVLVNNAGFAMSGFAEDIALNELRRQFDTNFFGHVAMTNAVLPVMRRQSSGHIIMVSSISGRMGQPVISSYSASKFALEGWSETLRLETHSLGIRVVLVEPGAFNTDIWDRNVVVGERALRADSPNRERAARFVEFVKKRVPKADAREVARLIARIAQDPNPKLRYIAGRDARFQLWLRRLLPWKRYEKMVTRFVGID
ncbi:MAG: SDR family oxidoreductase [Acidobacteriales bacterium]|nr:SDR family oxidoreductase [Terriglobales bacterium]